MQKRQGKCLIAFLYLPVFKIMNYFSFILLINFKNFLYEFMNLNIFDGFQLTVTIFLSESTLAGLCPARDSSAQLQGFSCQVTGVFGTFLAISMTKCSGLMLYVFSLR